MNGTPRLRSAFPTTPRTDLRSKDVNRHLRQSFPPSQPLPTHTTTHNTLPVTSAAAATGARVDRQDTVIPLNVVDGPTQRLYVGGLYVFLAAWRLYDSLRATDDLDSTWLFLKWLAIDAIFLLSLPALRIPWLAFGFSTTMTAWIVHAVGNAFLMYHIPIPVLAWLGSMSKVVYDRELSISEHRVKPADIIHNSSIILGKQIIQILPEGSAVLNPDKIPFCLDGNPTSVKLPIRINQTNPILIELLRYDLETAETETIIINAKQVKQLKRQADKALPKSDQNLPRTLFYSTSKTGLYQLQRVVDETRLEVRKRAVDTLVAVCPSASIGTGKTHKCIGDLSDLSLNVTGVAPFKVKYSKKVNKQQSSLHVQSVQPQHLESALQVDHTSGTLIDPRNVNLGWARPTTVTVSINESLDVNGGWSYAVDEVEDGFGNKVSYVSGSSDGRQKDPSTEVPQQSIVVHHRPKVFLNGCDAQTFLKVAEGDAVTLPIQLRDPKPLTADWPLSLKYTFTSNADEGVPTISDEVFDLLNEETLPQIRKAGKYSLASLSSKYCAGEIIEPSSCLLQNPPRPDMTLQSEDIIDKCAGKPIGLTVDVDFTGSPPFKVRYLVSHHGYAQQQTSQFQGLRGQIQLKPAIAGSYAYEFLEIEDAVYGKISLADKKLILRQDVKPVVFAGFADGEGSIKACLDQPVSVNVQFQGEAPFDLEYELVHGSKRKKFNVQSEHALYTITTPAFSEGGQQSLVLTSVQDKSKCKISIREERAIDVRPEQPRAAFGDIEGRRSVLALEGKSIKLPLRLKGVAPWSVRVANLDQPETPGKDHVFWDPNSVLAVDQAGTYEIVSVHDTCPGLVDPQASTFKVSWLARPSLAVKDNSVQSEESGVHRKNAVCVGDETSVTLALTGNAPFLIKYQQHARLKNGASGVSNKQITAAIASAILQMDTSKAGEYTYTFHELSDSRYAHDRKRFSPVLVHQQVHPLPSARFSQPGTTYGHCKNEVGTAQDIPITLDGEPPFAIEIAVTHHGSSRPDIVKIKDLHSNAYSWKMLRRGLDLGTHSVAIRKVQDSRGCEKIIEDDPSAVRIMVSDPPTIIPLESKTDYCVGEHVSYSLSGQPPFDVFYQFQGHERKARATSTTFRRIAEQPGEFTITALSDHASGKCKAEKNITKIIHPMPTVKMSRGKTSVADIHEGGEVEIQFEFTGTPPFEFTYTRSENAKKGKKAAVLETRNDESLEFWKSIRASDEGTYEVVAIKDRYCAFSLPKASPGRGKGQKLLQQ